GPVYLDCAATAPLDPRVRDVLLRHLEPDFGNAGSRTHEFGRRARAAVEQGRQQVATVVAASRGEVIFTSGATESNNLAIAGLEAHGRDTGKLHVVTTSIEHHAVLGPLEALENRGFEVTRIAPEPSGRVNARAVYDAVRADTLLISVMHVNNETGIRQPVEAIADLLADHPAYFHVDAAQSFGKEVEALQHQRIDLISVSGHKIHGPQGVGGLIARRRGRTRPPLKPLLHGGGQEFGFRSGTLPVPLIAAFGAAAEFALAESAERRKICLVFRQRLLLGLAPLSPVINGSLAHASPHIVNLSIPDMDAETVMEAWHDAVAVSNGAACSSQLYTCSHVLSAMRLPEERMAGALRLSWSHLTPEPDWAGMVQAILQVKSLAAV
ncbi:MAG: aminotransferase class V-fold PLP-dependent enzyme, partial [Bryobacteraceae bacterium]